MNRAPYVMGKAAAAFDRAQKIVNTTHGWRFVNPAMKATYGVDTMPQTRENVAEAWGVSREDQDRFAFAYQQKAATAIGAGRFASEIVPVKVPQRNGEPVVFA